MKVVLDTNVLVSGLLTPFGPSGEIIRMLSAGKLILHYDSRILLEYHEVLFRPKFKFNTNDIDTLIDFINNSGQIVPSSPLKKPLPDLDDEPFLEVAIAENVKCLITGNTAHYTDSSRQGITILSPSEFLEFYREENEYTEQSGED